MSVKFAFPLPETVMRWIPAATVGERRKTLGPVPSATVAPLELVTFRDRLRAFVKDSSTIMVPSFVARSNERVLAFRLSEPPNVTTDIVGRVVVVAIVVLGVGCVGGALLLVRRRRAKST